MRREFKVKFIFCSQIDSKMPVGESKDSFIPLLLLHLPPRPRHATSLHTVLPCWPSAAAGVTSCSSSYLLCCKWDCWWETFLCEDLDAELFQCFSPMFLFHVKCRNVKKEILTLFWPFIKVIRCYYRRCSKRDNTFLGYLNVMIKVDLVD